MDNFQIDVTAEGESALALALRLGLSQHSTVTHWAKHPEYGLVLFWADPGEQISLNGTSVRPHPFTSPMSPGETLTDTVLQFLQSADYGEQPRHDGDNGRGFRVFCEDWGHVGGTYQACLAICPAWALYGK